MTVETGLEQLIADGGRQLGGARVGLLTHPAAVLPDLSHGLDALLDAGAGITAVFGSEHGFRGTAQDGASEQVTVDPPSGLPVFDTYGTDAAGLAELLRKSAVEVLLVDLQHVGARFYTYESTLHDAIAAAAVAGVDVVVLDRPNPVGGVQVQGPVLDPAFSSFVGRAPIPLRHGMTMGELGSLFAELLDVPAPGVVPMRGWRPEDLFTATGLPWVPPSPNMPTPAAAICYPGTCLFEGTGLSVGRGTTTPFELCGAPWLDARLARELRAAGLPGVAFREAWFTPTFNRWAGERLCGVQLHLTDPTAFDPLLSALTVLYTAHRLWPGRLDFQPRTFDLLAGTDELRRGLEAGAEPGELIRSWSPGLAEFEELRRRHLRYPRLQASD
ncbi:exo-beta-N-acetylmuramidase NamZ domain-containing protein [Peterkaempfera sp. SMS 1(5)a]|uniref:exo-beta-N-acetylmuramidase NamZ family protein n=1 Tax=Peterkaempfera podocarpi TaxID=3232308 RepID=UPI00366CD5AE